MGKRSNRRSRRGFKSGGIKSRLRRAGLAPSIGSQVGSALAGHLSKAGKLKAGGSKVQNKAGQLTFKGLSNFMGSLFGGKAYADAMGQVTGKLAREGRKPPSQQTINRFLKHNIDIANPQPGFKINIDGNRAIEGIKNDTIRNWFSKWTPQKIKDLRINHQMYYSPKIKVGDPRWNDQGGSNESAKPDPQTEKYLEWMARKNPTGATVSEWKKHYAKNLANGEHTLQQVMRMNPAETMNFYALIDDTEGLINKSTSELLKSGSTTTDLLTTNNNSKTTDNKMALNQADVNKLYNEMLGRNATFGDASEYDADYWVGKTADQVRSGISGSSEFKNRAALVDAAGAGGISEADLDKSVLPGGWKTEHHSGYDSSAGDLFDFNRNNNWMSSTGGGNAWATEQNAINKVLGATAANNYSTGVPGVAGSGVTDGSVPTPPTAPVDPTVPVDPADPTAPVDPVKNWYDGYASGEDWLKANPQDGGKSGGMDDFMKFMMLMSVMGGGRGGGGYGGSQYGYGGLNPGGVQAAYNPLQNLQGFADVFKTLPGIGGGTGLAI